MVDAGWLSLVKAQRAIAVIRASKRELGVRMGQAVAAGGMALIEVTWNSHQAAQLVHQLQLELPDCMIGAGTLLTLDQLWEAIAAGAKFLFTPHVNLELIQAARHQQIPIISGALSPTEIVTAWQAGAASVKVFPVQSLGGAAYIRQLQGPLGQIPLIPTGGVTLNNASEFLQAGAIAVGISGELFPKQAIANADWQTITERAKDLMATIRKPEL